MKSLIKTISVPEGVTVAIETSKATIKGKAGEVSIPLISKLVKIEMQEGKVVIAPKIKETKREKCMVNTTAACIKNAIVGVQNPYVYKLKICSSHFPMSVKINGKNVEVTNYMGEKTARKATLPQGADVKLEGDLIIITSPDKARAGQVATQLEKLTKRPAFDRRVFMDGIYVIEKAGVSLE